MITFTVVMVPMTFSFALGQRVTVLTRIPLQQVAIGRELLLICLN